ncbi:MAG: integrase [Planctomycetota bacterium]|nr:MAG: integrase [Planctomycetota bacterium]
MMDRNMRARNFGLRSRDMNKAAKNALIERGLSYSSVGTLSDRFRVFSRWVRETHQVNDLRYIDQVVLEQYAAHIRDRVAAGELAVSTAQNYLSAVNTVIQQARQDRQVGINPVEWVGERSAVRTVNRATEGVTAGRAIGHSAIPYLERCLVIGQLGEQLGLRVKESSLLDARAALEQAITQHRVHIRYGTKGGRPRWVPIRSDCQVETLRHAARLQGTARSLIPPEHNWATWRGVLYRTASKLGLHGWHGGRHAYAQRLYERLTRCQPPVVVGISHGRPHLEYLARVRGLDYEAARALDRRARLQVAAELGHGRIDVTNSYLG